MDTEALRLELWAETGDRVDPESVRIDRGDGWTVGYEQTGSGLEPERLVFNQLVRELTGLFIEWAQYGILRYDPDVTYPVLAFATDSNGNIVRAVEANGPAAVGGVRGPETSAWTIY